MAEQQRRQFRLEAENSRLNVLMKLLQERTPESHQEQGVLLSEEEENLNKSVQSPQDPAKQQISFHAQLSNGFSTHFHDQDVVNMTYIWTNQGHAYNGTVGYFRAPISGTYFFIATAVTSRGPNRAAVVMWVNIRPVCFTDGWTSAREGDSSTCTAVVHVKTGQAVWLESIGEADFWYGSSFSGFLVSSDE
nr:hypothetical protein BaRGS_032734 [Batillaria attramentaria]